MKDKSERILTEKEDKDALEDRLKKISMASKRLKDGDADKDGDGKINYGEFMQAFTYIKPKGQV